ncbi:UDP-glucose--hexose-1-phosphate uridylyltransferase [Oribacterium sp.]
MVEELLQDFVAYGAYCKLVEEADFVYIYNSLATLLTVEPKNYSYEKIQEKLQGISRESIEDGSYLESLLSKLLSLALEKGVLKEDNVVERDLLDTRIMGILTDRPSHVQEKFREFYQESPQKATEYFYEFSQNNDYIRRYRIRKDIHFHKDTDYGPVEISINLSKPEKDPKMIALLGKMQSSSYPACMLCKESEGYGGRLDFPARENHRIIPLNLAGEEFYFQCSPYVYYPEHCIVFHKEHKPMRISGEIFPKLFSFVEQFPHYFVGSNADLPIVGGSILSHEHFQGGNYSFPMEKAEVEEYFALEGYPDIQAGIVNWPMSVIRLRGKNSAELSSCATMILERFRSYSDPAVSLHAFTEETPHNTITPIARRRGEDFELDLVLRNNLCTEEHPLGLFHPHEEYHHIKKENIGLIEVMGLAVLPARLKQELEELESALVSGEDLRKKESLQKHADWGEEILRKYPHLSSDNVHEIVQVEVAKVFMEVLSCAGIFKRNAEGKAAFRRFMEVISKA